MQGGQIFSSFQHVFECTECVHVVTFEPELIKPAQQGSEIEVTVTWLKVDFLAISEAVG